MNYIKDVNLRNENAFNMIIEIEKGSKDKNELVNETFDKLERVRKVRIKYPFYYGCLPQTYAGDKDPMDVVLLSKKKRKCLDIVKIYPIGVIKTIDNGEIDDKIIAVACAETIKHLDKLQKIACKFLKVYKGKNSNTIVDETFYDAIEAERLIIEANKVYENTFNKVQAKVTF